MHCAFVTKILEMPFSCAQRLYMGKDAAIPNLVGIGQGYCETPYVHLCDVRSLSKPKRSYAHHSGYRLVYAAL